MLSTQEANMVLKLVVKGQIYVFIIVDIMTVSVADWIDVAQDGDRWQALVNVVMNLQVP
jgi:hypothetical protein